MSISDEVEEVAEATEKQQQGGSAAQNQLETGR